MHRALIGLAFAAAVVLAAPSSSVADKGPAGVWNVATATQGAKTAPLVAGDSITVRIAKRKFWMMAVKDGKKPRRLAGTWKRVGSSIVLSVRHGKRDVAAFTLTGTTLKTARIGAPKAKMVLQKKLGKYAGAVSFALVRKK